MTQTASLPSSRSLGLKFIVILALIVLMAIPVMFISFISFDRSSRADEVSREVSQTYGGAQRLLGPVLVVPYRETLADGRIREGDYVLSGTEGQAVFENITVEEKSRSLYKVPVYKAAGTLSADLPSLDSLPQQSGLQFDRARARIVVGLGDVTGLQSDVLLRVGNDELAFEPYMSSGNFKSGEIWNDYRVEPAISSVSEMSSSDRSILYDRLSSGGMTLLSVPAERVLSGTNTQVQASLSLTGANSLTIAPYARSTTLTLSSDWPHPGFAGRFPPSERDITDSGFSASWSVPYLRRGIADQGRAEEMSALLRMEGDMRVNFVSPLNPYQTVNRALKYAVLFIGLVFLAYFLMETLLNVRVHPAQYLLIGIAQAIFYLLLLAFAEHIGFTLAFLISAAATVALTAGYAGAVFGRDKMGISALVFSAVYGLLFVLMRIQDFALMVGALVSFIAIAATLYLTRNLNWYGDKMSDPES